ncbi:MAG: septum formation initiator family protein [Sodalis sp. (in: enterobacteria)]
MRKLILLLVTLLSWLQYSLWLGKNGILDLRHIESDIAKQQNNKFKLKARNDQVFAKIDNLNASQKVIEELSRNKFDTCDEDGGDFFLSPIVPKHAQEQTAMRVPQGGR